MTNHYILIDANNLAFQAQSAGMSKRSRMKRLYSGEYETTAIFGVLQSVREIQVRWPRATLLMLWDAGEIWRYRIYPDYKGSRKVNKDMIAIKEALAPQRDRIKVVSDLVGIPQVEAPGFEADDIAAFMSHLLASKGHKVTLVTRDQDWLQCVAPGVDWYNKYDDKLVTALTFTAETGFANADQFVEGKMLKGDVSDNIPGAKGIGPVAITAIFEEFASIQDLLDRFPTWVQDMPKGHPLGRARKAIETLIDDPVARRDLLVRNRALMDLRKMHGNKKLAAAITKTRGVTDKAALTPHLMQLAFLSIQKDLDRWLEPFVKTPISE